MGIVFDTEHQLFHLATQHTSYIFSVFDSGFLYHQYWGKRIRTADLTGLWQVYPGLAVNYPGAPDNRYSQDIIPAEYPFFGKGDFRNPAVSVRFENGSRLVSFTYRTHRILTEKPQLDGLPSLHGADAALELVLADEVSGLELLLRYAVFEDCDVITRSAELKNCGAHPAYIERLFSFSLDLPPADYECIDLCGCHLRERQVERTPLRSGMQSIESRRGASSPNFNPFFALVSPHTTEDEGEAYGAALVYSGNFFAGAEQDNYGFVRLQMGINPFQFSWKLGAGECFIAPEAVLTYSACGLNRMSQNFHRAFRYHLGHALYKNKPRPVVINNWEGTYFDFDEQKILSMIRACDGLGLDVFVLDDGWFGKRDDDTTSLGDWFIDREKLPHGLTPLIEQCEAQGMRFGLWVEPEMVSPDSELYRAHPDWAIQDPQRESCLGRNQMVLDLSREDVFQYLLSTIRGLLNENRISYIKWDMNRHITDAYSKLLPAEQQGELAHRYILNYYRLMDALCKEFPQVIFEGCSSGGGRFDAGVLYYQPQIWTSDDSDAIARLRIQYGTSFVYPPECMTAHVSACPNHQVGRMTPFHTRGLVAMSASFGYELNPLTLTEEERAQVKQQVETYKNDFAPLVVGGEFYRLTDPFVKDDCGWMFVSPEQDKAVVVYARQLIRPSVRAVRVKLRGLDPDAVYHIRELSCDMGGDVLMNAGLTVPVLEDFEAVSYTLERK